MGQLLSAGKKAGALSAETIPLCSVLKGYRDLVHPGLVVRAGMWPNAERADLAAMALERVLTDVDSRIRKRPEWAAEFLLYESMDYSTHAVTTKKRVDCLSDQDLRRLLVELLPAEAQYSANEPDYDEAIRGCRTCFTEAWRRATDDVRRAAAQAVQQAEEASIPWGDGVAEALASVELIGYLDPDDGSILAGRVVAELHSQLQRGVRPDLAGIGPFLSKSDAATLVHTLVDAIDAEDAADYALDTLGAATSNMSEECRRVAVEMIDPAAVIYRKAGDASTADRLMSLRFRIAPLTDSDIPR